MKIKYVLAAALLPLGLVSCSFPRATMTHLTWTFERNLIVLDARVGGAQGEFLVGSAQPETILDDDLAVAPGVRGTVPVTIGRYAATARPIRANLEGLADGILGADVWGGRSLTIDYRRRVLILDLALEPIDAEIRHRFRGAPSVSVVVDGREELAIIDTASPDTILLPSARFGPEGRAEVELVVAGVRFHSVDAAIAPVSEIRLGNRILAEFLVTIDYARHETSLWHNP